MTFVEKGDLPIDRLNQTLAGMSERRQPPRQVAKAFLRDQPQVWKPWGPGEVASKRWIKQNRFAEPFLVRVLSLIPEILAD